MSKPNNDLPSNVIHLAERRRTLSRPASVRLSDKRPAPPMASLAAAATLLGARGHTGGAGAENDNIDPAYIVRLAIRHGTRHGRPPARMPRFIRQHLDNCCQRGDAACIAVRDWLNGNRDVLQRLGSQTTARPSADHTEHSDASGKGRV